MGIDDRRRIGSGGGLGRHGLGGNFSRDLKGSPGGTLFGFLPCAARAFLAPIVEPADHRPHPCYGPAEQLEDVRHLEALAAKLWLEVRARGIEPEVLEETQYRIASAAASAALPPPPPEAAYLRLKGSDRLGDRQLATLRAVAAVREREAERRDVPVHQVASAEALVALVRARPTTVAEVARVRGFGLATPEALAFAGGLVRAIAAAGDTLPPDERAHFHPVHPPAALVRVRRERENRLIAWRRSEAKLRTVDEQVVLPGHCLKHAAYTDVDTIDGLSHVPGIGGFRVERDGPAILRVLAGEWTAPPSAVAPADGNGA